MAVGGDIREITFNHPTIGAGRFNIISGEDSTFDPGGLRNEGDVATSGNGDPVYQKNRKPWFFEGTAVWDMNITDDVAIAKQLAESAIDAVYTIEHINGSVYKASGQVVGDIVGNMNTARFPLKISGGGEAKKIS